MAMTTVTVCPTCGEHMDDRRCANCWTRVDPVTLDRRDVDQLLTPIERRVNMRLRRALDEMHEREIRERAAALARR